MLFQAVLRALMTYPNTHGEIMSQTPRIALVLLAVLTCRLWSLTS